MNAPHSDTFSSLCGAVGLLGCLGVVAGDVAGIIVYEPHNPISETISNLAAGQYAWIQDISLDLFAASSIASGLGLANWRLGAFRWKAAAALLVMLGVDLVLIAEHNQYAGRNVPGATIHTACVYALGALFTLITFLLASDLRRIGPAWARFDLTVAVIWIIAAPFFFLVPTGWDGAYERTLALMVVIWFAAISWLLIKRGRGDAHTPHAEHQSSDSHAAHQEWGWE